MRLYEFFEKWQKILQKISIYCGKSTYNKHKIYQNIRNHFFFTFFKKYAKMI